MELTKSHIAILVCCFVAGILVGKSCVGRAEVAPTEPIHIHDTISVTDTIIEERVRTLYTTRTDTIILQQRDSIVDTIRVEIPISHNLYADHIVADSGVFDVGIKYSGYKARLDSVGISYRATIEPPLIEKKRGFGQFIGIGLGVGYGANLIDNRVFAAPYVGVHITYGFGYTWRK